MGSRIGYRVRDKNGVSPIFRKQWARGTTEGLEKMMAFLDGGAGPGSGMGALRSDLDRHQAFAAMVVALYEPPFDSIEDDPACDIADNGLLEVDISRWDKWMVYLYPIAFSQAKGDCLGTDDPPLVATVEGGQVHWIADRRELGEGL